MIESLVRAIVRAASLLVPREERPRWIQEWEAEIAHRLRGDLDTRASLRLLRRCFGAFRHALWHLREAWRWEAFSQDFRQAVRALRQRPGFVVAASITLAAGVGSATALFSVIEAVLLRPLPYSEPERLAYLYEVQQGGERHNPAPANILDFRRESRALSEVAAWWVESTTLLGDSAHEAEEVPSAMVTADFFAAFGVEPLLGRAFEPREVASEERITVLSFELWQRRFGGERTIVGRDIRFRDASWRVIGVMPADFRTPGTLEGEVQLFKPWDFERDYAHHGAVPRDWRFVRAAARLAEGVSLEEAQSEIQAIAAALASAHPATNRGWTAELVPLREVLVGHAQAALLVLAGAVGFLLLLACVNVAGLLLVRASARGRELAVRTALGASRGRLARQLLMESALLALAGGLLGAAIAWAGVALLVRLQPGGIFRIEETVLDGRVLAFALVASLVAGLLSGLAPAFQSATEAPSESLKGSGGVVSLDRRRLRLRSALVVAEIALSVALLVGTMLFLRSFGRVVRVDPGFDPENLLVVRMRLDDDKYRKGGAHHYYSQLLSEIRTLPGVESAGGSTALPMDSVDVDFDRPFWREGEARPAGGGGGVRLRMTTTGYFETMRIPLLAGRIFDEHDDRTKPRILIVNETMARSTWEGENPLGKRLVLDYQDLQVAYEVVGVVGDTRFDGYRSRPAPEAYIPHAQNPYLPMNLVIRTASPLTLAPLVRKTVLELDASEPVHSLGVMADLARTTLASDRFSAVVMTVFGAVALLLATIGLYGVVAQSVGQRQREMGLRMALGADRRNILALVLGGGLRLAVAGALLGVLGAVAASRFLTSLLFETSPTEPLAMLLAVAISIFTVSLACVLPARRAARLDPKEALYLE
ncbi:MAG TPA: ABC transporter permease [Vicinamibacteria bacterium]|nr:ABC transporter permease [Vicinamibacteria bacterium]